MYKIGVIGLGKRMSDVIQTLEKNEDCCLSYVADPRIDEIKAALKTANRDISKIEFFSTAEEMLEQTRPDGICIGTRCSLHAKYADAVIRKDYPLFLEKPVCTNRKDLAMLEKLLNDCPDSCRKATVSFPLRYTPHVAKVKEIIESGVIGNIAHVQAWNNVPYAIGYYHKWYRDDNETGGLFLQKSTHDFDYITYICGSKPTLVCAMESKQVFKGEHEVGLLCRNCLEKDSCPDYTPEHGRESSKFDQCCFAKDTGNHDSASAIIMFENGVHAVYSQNFIARRSAGSRGARFIGHYGTVEFDWVTNEITVHNHYKDSKEIISIKDSNSTHFGGDDFLVHDFCSTMGGQDSKCSLIQGIESAKLCLCAKESALENRFVKI